MLPRARVDARQPRAVGVDGEPHILVPELKALEKLRFKSEFLPEHEALPGALHLFEVPDRTFPPTGGISMKMREKSTRFGAIDRPLILL